MDIISSNPKYLKFKPGALWRSDSLIAETIAAATHATPLYEVAMLPLSRQPWTAYIGNKADGVFRP